ncbi:fibronectin type III domain-containing protein [Tetraselmis virus 1]|uniref:Fibronectin type III domain-containing protein n=1 Tax=Tetraselmis virus 1 TaxID=2060617 RepID=A0A2P0VNJ9_9VIRU|nr:fibronectin type III domain-containing protein [Tetraselmis virus 1]AUF82483.1 fibronectin type III domain-containing protein [Tetraselmis virus 1]
MSYNIPSLSNNIYNDGSFVIAGDEVISIVTIVDSNFKQRTIVNNIVNVIDHKAPSFTTVPFINAITESGFTVNWVLTDSGDTNQSLDTASYIGIYDNNTIPPTTDQVIAGTGNDFVQKIDITDGKNTTSYVVNTLNPSTQYYVYLVAQDSAGNKSYLVVMSSTTIDTSPPSGLSSVTLALGSNASSEATISGLQSIVDNVEVSSITIKYGTVNDPEDGGTVSVPVTLSSGSAASDTQTVSGLTDNTQYYFWTQASDTSSNESANVATTPSSITTDIALVFNTTAVTDSTTTVNFDDYTTGEFPIFGVYADTSSACNVIVPGSSLTTPADPASTDIAAGTGSFTVATSTTADITSYEIGSTTYGEVPLLPGTEYVLYATSKNGSDTVNPIKSESLSVITTGSYGLLNFGISSGYSGADWSLIDSALGTSTSLSQPAILTNNAGTIVYTGFQTAANQPYTFYTYEGSSWTSIGNTPQGCDPGTEGIATAITSTGILYVYSSNPSQVTVGFGYRGMLVKYDSGSWSTISASIDSFGIQAQHAVCDSNDYFYGIMRGNSSGSSTNWNRVYRYTGTGSIVSAITIYSGNNGGNKTGLTINNNDVLYAAIRRNADSNIYVWLFDTAGSWGSAWTAVGGAINDNASGNVNLDMACDSQNNVYVLYVDNTSGIIVKYVAEGENTWSTLGTPVDTSYTANLQMSISINSSDQVVVQYSNNSKAAVKYYNGSSWVALGTQEFSSGTAVYSYNSWSDTNGKTYVAVTDTDADQLEVYEIGGSSATENTVPLQWTIPSPVTGPDDYSGITPMIAALKEDPSVTNDYTVTVSGGTTFQFSPSLPSSLVAGRHYLFDVSDSTNTGHQLAFSSQELPDAPGGNLNGSGFVDLGDSENISFDQNTSFSSDTITFTNITGFLKLSAEFTADEDFSATWVATGYHHSGFSTATEGGYMESAQYAFLFKAWTDNIGRCTRRLSGSSTETGNFPINAGLWTWKVTHVSSTRTFSWYADSGELSDATTFRLSYQYTAGELDGQTFLFAVNTTDSNATLKNVIYSPLPSASPVAYNTTLTGTPGQSGATVLFVPRTLSSVYAFSVDDGDFAFGSTVNPVDVDPAMSSVNVYNGTADAGSVSQLEYVSRVELTSQGGTPYDISYYSDYAKQNEVTLPYTTVGGGSLQNIITSDVVVTASGATSVLTASNSNPSSMNFNYYMKLNGSVSFGVQIFNQGSPQFRVYQNSTFTSFSLTSPSGDTTNAHKYVIVLDVANTTVIVYNYDSTNTLVQSESLAAPTLVAGTYQTELGGDPNYTVTDFQIYNEALADVTSVLDGASSASAESVVYGDTSNGEGALVSGSYYNFYGILSHESGLISPVPSFASALTYSPFSYAPPAGFDRYVFEVTSLSAYGVANGDHVAYYISASLLGGVSSGDLTTIYSNVSGNTPGFILQGGWVPLGGIAVYDVAAGSSWTGVTFGGMRPSYRGGLTITRNEVEVHQDNYYNTAIEPAGYSVTFSW